MDFLVKLLVICLVVLTVEAFLKVSTSIANRRDLTVSRDRMKRSLALAAIKNLSPSGKGSGSKCSTCLGKGGVNCSVCTGTGKKK